MLHSNVPYCRSTGILKFAFSTESAGVTERVTGWWEQRNKTKQAETYRKKIDAMAKSEEWRIGSFKNELEEISKAWQAKIPLLSDAKEVKAAKDMLSLVEAMCAHLGNDATVDQLRAMSRTDKLKVSLEADKTVEDVNILTEQFEAMTIMQRVLRKQFLDGQDLPDSEEDVSALVQKLGPKLMTKDAKDRFSKTRLKAFKRTMRRG